MSEFKQIKRHHERQLKDMGKKLTMYQIHPDDVSWLINRIGELENENRILKSLAKSNKFIGEQYLEQNKRYRQSIEVAIHNLKDSDNLGVKFALKILEQALEGSE